MLLEEKTTRPSRARGGRSSGGQIDGCLEFYCFFPLPILLDSLKTPKRATLDAASSFFYF